MEWMCENRNARYSGMVAGFHAPLCNLLNQRSIHLAIRDSDMYSVMLKDYPDVMNIEEMSRALGVSTKTGYKLLRTGKITAMKVGRTYRIPKVHLLTYLQVLDAGRAS